jgi:hypothetical protein
MKRLPLTTFQKVFWLDFQLNDNSEFSKVYPTIKLVGDVNIEKLTEAIKIFTGYFEGMRMSIKIENDQTYQICPINDYLDFKNEKILNFIDLFDKNLNEDDNYKNAINLHFKIINEKINMFKQPTFKFYLVKYFEKKFIYFIIGPHIFGDGLIFIFFFFIFFLFNVL